MWYGNCVNRTFLFFDLSLFFVFAGIAHAAVYSNDSSSVDINYTGPAPGSISVGGIPGTTGGTNDPLGGQGGTNGDSGQSGITIPVTVVTGNGGSTGAQTGQGGTTSDETESGGSITGEDVLSALFGSQGAIFGPNGDALGGSSGGGWGTISISAKKAREALSARNVRSISIADILNSRFFSREDFTLVAASKVLENKTIEEIILTLDTLSLTYRSEGRLFAVFPLSYPITLVVNPNLDTPQKRVEVKFPWYRFFLQTFVSRSELQAQINAAINQAIAESETSADLKTKVLIAVSLAIESRFDTVEGTLK